MQFPGGLFTDHEGHYVTGWEKTVIYERVLHA